MGLFRKKSYHVDEAGRVAEGEEQGYKSVKELRGPSRWEQYKQSRGEERKAYNEGVREAKANLRINRIKKAREQGRRAGSITFTDRLESFAKGVAGPSKPIKQTRGRSYNVPMPSFGMKYNTKMNSNPFGNMFDTGIKKQSFKKPSTKYAVVSGKAYPLASVGKKKHKKKSKSSNVDMFDNWGLMR